MKTQKVLALALAMCMVLALAPLTALAAGNTVDSGACGATGNEENVTWALTANNGDANDLTLTISGKGAMADYDSWHFPSWSNYDDIITKVVVEEGITNIGDSFAGGFVNAYWLSALTSVTLPSTLKEIGSYAFYNCSDALTTINLPEGLETIGGCAFWYCDSLTCLRIPSTVKELGIYSEATPFHCCSSLSISVAAGNPFYEVSDGALRTRGDNATLLFYNRDSDAVSYTMPDDITAIAPAAFYCCGKLENVILSARLTAIPSDAFAECKALKSLTIPEGVTEIGGSAFYGCDSLTDLKLPESLTTLDSSCFGIDPPNRLDITVPVGVTEFYSSNDFYEPVENEAHKIIWRFQGDAPEVFVIGTICNTVVYYPKGASGWDELAERYASDEMVTFIYTPAPVATGWTVTEAASCRYDYVTGYFSNGLMGVSRDGKEGFVDTTGAEVIPCQYDSSLYNFSNGLAAVERDGKCGFIDVNGTEVVSCKYDQIGDFSNGLARVFLNEKWGFVNSNGTEVVPIQYDNVGDFSEGFAMARRDGKWGFVDTTGAEVVFCKYDQVGDFSGGLAAVCLNEKWGFVDATGAEVIPCKYTTTLDFTDGLAAVCLNGKWGFIDATGAEVISRQYDDVWKYEDVFVEPSYVYIVTSGAKYGAIDQTGKQIVPCQYDNIRVSYGDDFAFMEVKLDGKWGLIDKTGAETIPCQYDEMYGAFHDGYSGSFYVGEASLALVILDGKYGLLNAETGEVVVSIGKYNRIDWVYSFEDVAHVAVSLNGENGLIDVTGAEVVPVGKYNSIGEFSSGLAAVKLGGVYGYVDTTGELVIPRRYEYADNFVGSLAAVQTDGTYGVIDRTGGQVVPCGTYDSLSIVYSETRDDTGYEKYIAAVEQNGKYGLLSITRGERTALTGSMFTVDAAEEAYTGQAIFKTIQSALTEDVDYTVTYANNTDRGTATITIQGVGNYTGVLQYTFPIAEVKTGSLIATEGGETLAFTCSETGTVTAATESLPQDEAVLAACYDAQGKFLGVQMLTRDKQTGKLSGNFAKVKLFWLNDKQSPLAPSVTVWGQ